MQRRDGHIDHQLKPKGKEWGSKELSVNCSAQEGSLVGSASDNIKIITNRIMNGLKQNDWNNLEGKCKIF